MVSNFLRKVPQSLIDDFINTLDEIITYIINEAIQMFSVAVSLCDTRQLIRRKKFGTLHNDINFNKPKEIFLICLHHIFTLNIFELKANFSPAEIADECRKQYDSQK
ncbi:CLUMA_CG002826, isoform A [Clunio marinus]|uniref:CLUMA_CG002826, isoform A n=1 Tax=Clunio marinus TaxID=568069 RepID=A0A1J1HL68_9DIPT|nr:CLUMA_CG002826, isoform A [Clunio marinus]